MEKNNNTKTIKIRRSLSSQKKVRFMDRKNIIKATTIIYDENLDILDAYTDKATDYSKNINDFVIIHFSKDNELTGFELLDISKNINVPKNVLKNLKSVEMSVCAKPEEKMVIFSAKMFSMITKKQTSINFITTPMEDKISCPIC